MFSSSTFKHNTSLTLTLRSSLQLPKIIHATFWDLLFNFLLSLMIHSEISFPFKHSTIILLRSKNLKNLSFDFLTVHHHWSYSPRSSFQSSTILPPLMLRPKIFRTLLKTWVVYRLPWFATQFWVSGVGLGHYEILPIQPANLKKKTPFQQNRFFFKMPALPCMSTSM